MARRRKTTFDLAHSAGPNTIATRCLPIAAGIIGVGGYHVATVPWIPLATAAVAGTAAFCTWRIATDREDHGHPFHTWTAAAKMWVMWGAAVSVAIWSQPLGWSAGAWIAAAAAAAVLVAVSLMWLRKAQVPDAALWEERADMLDPDKADERANEIEMHNVREEDRGDGEAWVGYIEKVLKIRTKVTGFTRWEKVAEVVPGFTMRIELPNDGQTTSDAFSKDVMRRLAATVPDLPRACIPIAERGATHREVILHINTVDLDQHVIEHPRDWSRLTVNGRLPWVYSPQGSDITIKVREKGIFMVGPPGTGKTTLLDALLAAFARCDDVLVFGLDTAKGGFAFWDWTMDLAPGAKSPVVKVGATYEHGLALVEALQRIAADRVRRYGRWMSENNTKLVPIGPKCPMIILVIDEGAEVFEPSSDNGTQRKLQKAVLSLKNTTRQAGIRTVTTFIDGNVSVIGDTNMKKGNIRVALVGDGEGAETEGAEAMFPGLRGIDARDLTTKGKGIGHFGAGGPQVFRGPNMGPVVNREAVAATSAWRPELPPEEVALLGAAAAVPSIPSADENGVHVPEVEEFNADEFEELLTDDANHWGPVVDDDGETVSTDRDPSQPSSESAVSDTSHGGVDWGKGLRF